MSNHIKLADGRSFTLQCDEGTWHVTIDGKFYCAADKDTLVRGLENHIIYLKPKIVVPDKHPIQKATDTLKSDQSTLNERKEAREMIKQYAAKGDVLASVLLSQLDSKPVSIQARNFTKRMQKFEFADVTHEELVQHVPNVVLRTQLILELADRLRF